MGITKLALFEAIYEGLESYRFFNWRFEDEQGKTSCGVASLERDLGRIGERISQILNGNRDVVLGTCLPDKTKFPDLLKDYELFRCDDVLLEKVAEKLTERGVDVKFFTCDLRFNYKYFK